MSDKLKQTLINTTFADGEQITGAKLNGALGQLEDAIEFINKAIGDINNQNSSNAGSNVSNLSILPSSGPSLGRLVGSANWLNPKRLGLVRKTITLEMGYIQGGEISYEISSGNAPFFTKHFRLPFPPVILTKNYIPGGNSRKTMGDLTVAYSWDGAPGSWAIAAPTGGTYTDGTAKVATRVSNYEDLNQNGEYLVTPDGTIILYQSLDSSPEGFKLTYTFDTIGDAFTGATLNVIPDFAQVTTLCDVTDNGDGTYDVVLPTIEALMGSEFSGGGFTGTFGGPDFTLRSKDPNVFHPYDNASFSGSPSTGSPSYGTQCTLPEIIETRFSDSETIPEGYIYIWDEETDSVLNSGTFTYLSSTSVRVSGLTLVAGTNRYRIVVPGADTSHIVSNLKESYVRHTHDGRIDSDGIFRGERIRHADLICPNAQYDGFTHSEWGPEVNPHPQYLARWGHDTNDGGTTQGEGNFQNIMSGDLVFGTANAPNSEYAVTSDSYGIYFGSGSGPYFWYDQSDDTLNLSNKAITINTASPVSPTPKTLYSDLLPSAWANIRTVAVTPTIANDVNVSGVVYTGVLNAIQVTFAEDMENTDYVVSVTNAAGPGAGISNVFFSINNKALGGFDIICYDTSGLQVSLNGWDSGNGYIDIIVMGGWN